MKPLGICKNCQKTYQKGSNVQVYCSRECEKQYWIKNPKPLKFFDKTCINCTKSFKTTIKKVKFCSNVCANQYNGKLGKIGGNNVSLEKFIERHGEEIGKELYNKYITKLSNSLKGKESSRKGISHTPAVIAKITKAVYNSIYHISIRGKPFDDIRGAGASKKLSKKMKGTFSLKWFIEKYGEEKGKKLYADRSVQVSKKSYFKIYNKLNKNNYSKISQELFWAIYKKDLNLKNETVYFAELNHEYSCGISHHNFDFVVKNRKKVIEFYGDKFHANPIIYNENDHPSPYNLITTSKDIWESDRKLRNELEAKGYRVLIIWEKDYKEDKIKTVNFCKEFLNESWTF